MYDWNMNETLGTNIKKNSEKEGETVTNRRSRNFFDCDEKGK